jgi:hypothetical protein
MWARTPFFAKPAQYRKKCLNDIGFNMRQIISLPGAPKF